MEAELHDGTILEFPDGTDPQVIQATVKKMLGQSQPKDLSQIDTELTLPEKIATAAGEVGSALGTAYQKLVPSFLRPLLPNQQNLTDFAAGQSSLMRGGANLLQKGYQNAVEGMSGTSFPENTQKLGDTLWPTSAASESSGYRTAGTVADPVSAAIGGGVGKVIPYATVTGKGLVEGAKAVGQNALAGSVMGGAVGGLSENGTAGEGAAMGAALGTLLPVAVATGKYIGKTVGELADILSPGGAKRISNRYVNTIIGKDNKAEIAKALANADDLLVGSKPTAAEAVSGLPSGSPIQAHQQLVSQEPKGVSAQFGQRIAEKQAARESALSFAGTEDDVQRLVKERTAAVQPMYKAVENSTAKVRAIPVLHEVDNILSKNQNRDSVAIPLNKIRNALVIKTDLGSKLESNPQNLKSLSDQIGDMMGKKTPTGQPEFDVKVLSNIKEKLDEQIGRAVPEYQQAQQVYADMSKPINVMKIGQHLKDKLLNVTGTETPGTFLRTLNNEKKLLKDSIGFGRKGVEDYLSPEQLKNVENVAKDLEREFASKHPLQKTNLRGGVNVAGENTISLPNLLSRPAMFANYVIKSVGRNIEPEIDAYMTQLYLNPKELSKVISQIPQAQRSQFGNIVRNYGRAATVNAGMSNEPR